MRGDLHAWLVTGLLPALACARPAPPAADLRLVGVEPSSELLHLNQEIVLKFDRRLDPASVTEDTVRVLDEAGGRVPGRLRVRTFTITFHPVVPTSADLSDGSFQPGRRYSCQLPAFPRANSLRGARGEILRAPENRSWRAVDFDTLPAESPSPLLPAAESGRFQVDRPPMVAADGSWIELHFDRPVYPRSARTGAFKLVRAGTNAEVALRSVRVVASEGPWRGARVLRLEPVFPLTPGSYTLSFVGGADAIRDYRLTAAVLPVRDWRDEVRWVEQGYLHLVVEAGRAPAPIDERFAQPRDPAIVEPAAGELRPGGLGLGDDVDGYLVWGPDGLYAPALPADFASLGSFRPAATQVMKAGATVEVEPGRSVRLPDGRWDFDRFVVPRGVLCHIVVDGSRGLTIRIGGRLDVQGQIVFRFVGQPPRLPEPLPAAELHRGDPSTRWQPGSGHVAVLVTGLCDLRGAILRRDEPAAAARPTPAPVGYLRGRGPFLGPWNASALEPWGDRAPIASGADRGPPLPGHWIAISPWYSLDGAALTGRCEVTGVAAEVGSTQLEVLVQERLAPEGEGGHAWILPSLVAARGPLQALRFAVRIGEPRAGALLARAVSFQ